jgi:hypothetical protein
VIGLGGELHYNGTHRRSLLIQRKDRVPNRSVRTIRRLRCQLSRSDFGGQLASDAEHWPTSIGQFSDGCDPSEPNWAGRPLYRPRDNLAMLHGGLAKLVRMSTRNMW